MDDLQQKYRPLARTRAGAFSSSLKNAVSTGANVYQKSIDLGDEELAFQATLPEDHRELYSILYAQELEALTKAANDEVTKINQSNLQQAIDSIQAWHAITLIFVIVAAIFFIRAVTR